MKGTLAVLISLGKSSPANGLFLGPDIEMDSSQDVALDGGESIPFPGSGGGLAVLLLLGR